LKVIILSAVVALVLAYASSFVLSGQQEPSYQAYVGSGARVGDPGYNLVGPEWTGNPPRPAAAPSS
jgi:hypothetical protein